MTVNLPDNLLMELSPSTIRVDAQAYQFRLGADGRTGVTRQYRYEDAEWNPEKHGKPLIVHQRLNGQYYVADGHHRLEFAKRLSGQGKGPQALSAYVFREADGYSVKDVRLIAAYRNMDRGRSSVMESARVLHEAAQTPGMHEVWLPDMKMDGNMQVAHVISGLSERALDTVVENGISNEVAARAATQFTNPAVQEGFLNILANDVGLKKSYAEKINLERLSQTQLERN